MTESVIIRRPTLFNVLLVGDSCIDEYYIGQCDRLSPEAPVPVLNVNNHYTTRGMAANVKANLNALGWDVDFVTNSEIIKKTRFIDSKSGQHLLRVDDEKQLPPWDERTPLMINEYDVIIISDYNKGFLNYDHYKKLFEYVRVPVFIDTKKKDLKQFKQAYVKINEYEYKNRTSDCDNLIVTLGGLGARYQDRIYPSKKVDVVDVCGAGDTFFASLVFAYMNFNGDIEKAITFANKAGSISVQHQGNYCPTLEEINNA